MSELKLMTWQNKESNEVNEAQVIKECVQHNLCSKLQSMFGLGTADTTEHIKQNPEYYCQALCFRNCMFVAPFHNKPIPSAGI